MTDERLPERSIPDRSPGHVFRTKVRDFLRRSGLPANAINLATPVLTKLPGRVIQ